MTTRASDKLAALFAPLSIQSPQSPGKPPKKKPEPRRRAKGGGKPLPSGSALRRIDERAAFARAYRQLEPNPDKPGKLQARPIFTGALAYTRCGATQTQSRSVRLGGESAQDIGSYLAAVRDPLDRALVIYTAVPAWRLNMGALALELRDRLTDRALDRAWDPIVTAFTVSDEDAVQLQATRPELEVEPGDTLYDIDIALERRIVFGVLRELGRADACLTCEATGHVLDLKAKPPKLVMCKVCLGTKRVRLGVEKRAKLVKMRAQTYRHSDVRTAYEWLIGDCTDRITRAAVAIAAARGEGETYTLDDLLLDAAGD
jgi:hypothetical protein